MRTCFNALLFKYFILWLQLPLTDKNTFFDNFEWLNDQMPRWSQREDYGCCLQSYLNHLTSWHGPVQSVNKIWDVLVGEFSYQYRNNDDNDIVTRVSLETRLTKTDSSHVQEYVWLFAKQSINWQLCIGGVNSEIEITHTYFSNGQNISTLQMYSKILVRLHSSLHIYQITFSDIFTSMYLVASSNYTRTKKYTQYPHSLKFFSSG